MKPVHLLWPCSLVLAAWAGYCWQPRPSAEVQAAARHRPLAVTPLALDADSSQAEASTPEVFDPARRPNFVFTGAYGAGRRAVVANMLEHNNLEAASGQAQMAFTGLDEAGRRTALAEVLQFTNTRAREASLSVLTAEWAAQDPKGAFAAIAAVEDPQIRGEALQALWTNLLQVDPESASRYFTDEQAPPDWMVVLDELRPGPQDDYPDIAAAVDFVLRLEALPPEHIPEALHWLSLERWGSVEEAIDLWERATAQMVGHPQGEGYMTHLLPGYLAAYLEHPADTLALRQWALELPDPLRRAQALVALADGWIAENPAEALAATGSLPEGLREPVHGALFSHLMQSDPDAAQIYFDQLPGEAREHVLATSASTWARTLDTQSLLELADQITSPLVYREVLEAALSQAPSEATLWRLAFSYEDGSSAHFDPSPFFSRIDQLSAAFGYRQAFLERVYTAWAYGGDVPWSDIQQTLIRDPHLDAAQKAALAETLPGAIESAKETRASYQRQFNP